MSYAEFVVAAVSLTTAAVVFGWSRERLCALYRAGWITWQEFADLVGSLHHRRMYR